MTFEDVTLSAVTDDRGTWVLPRCADCGLGLQATEGEQFETLRLSDLIALAEHHNVTHHEGEL